MNTLTISERLELAKKYNLKEWKSKTSFNIFFFEQK
jgi:hypothetical protein